MKKPSRLFQPSPLALPRPLLFRLMSQNNSQGLTSQLSTTVVASHILIPAGIGEKTDPVGLSLRVTSITPIGKTQRLKKASSSPLRTTKASNFCPYTVHRGRLLHTSSRCRLSSTYHMLPTYLHATDTPTRQCHGSMVIHTLSDTYRPTVFSPALYDVFNMCSEL